MTSADTLTGPVLFEPQLRRIPPSGDIREDLLEPKPAMRGSSTWLRFVSSAVFAFAPTVTSMPLPAPPYDRRRETSSVISFIASSRGRRITLAEARELALAAMEQAEQRRAAFAEREAKLVSVWEEGG